MQNVLAIALSGMQDDVGRLDRVAQNMTNLATPGYKREVAVARPFGLLVQQGAGPHATDAPEDAGAAGAARSLVLLDTRAGTLATTGNALDVALQGDGFLEVATREGTAYTRRGDLGVDAQGRLVTAAGDPVMGTSGEIRLATRTPVIDAAGRITEPDAPAGSVPSGAQLKVVRFESTQGMRELGGGLLGPGTTPTPATDADARVLQGHLEGSNTSTMQEMVQVIRTMRHFESMQKVVQGYDDLLGTAITKLGELS